MSPTASFREAVRDESTAVAARELLASKLFVGKRDDAPVCDVSASARTLLATWPDTCKRFRRHGRDGVLCWLGFFCAYFSTFGGELDCRILLYFFVFFIKSSSWKKLTSFFATLNVAFTNKTITSTYRSHTINPLSYYHTKINLKSIELRNICIYTKRPPKSSSSSPSSQTRRTTIINFP